MKQKSEQKKPKDVKDIHLALQGGGSLGAFTWGVLESLLLDERVKIEAISGTSAGAMNAVVMTYGLQQGGREGAIKLLRDFWRKISVAASVMPFRSLPFDAMMGGFNTNYSMPFMAMDAMTRMLSPYQFNVLDINPLRDILEELVDFDALRSCNKIKLHINATNVRTGKIKVFDLHEITLDAVMASACLPFIFKTVWIDGEPYWDGGYSGNPAIYPLIYKDESRDVVIVQINPLYVEEVPKGASEILDRINEISFNATLMREMRAIAFVSKLKGQGKLESGYKDMHIHMIESDEMLTGLGRMSKMNPDWDFLSYLHDAGMQASKDWLDNHYTDIGKRSSVDLNKVFM